MVGPGYHTMDDWLMRRAAEQPITSNRRNCALRLPQPRLLILAALVALGGASGFVYETQGLRIPIGESLRLDRIFYCVFFIWKIKEKYEFFFWKYIFKLYIFLVKKYIHIQNMYFSSKNTYPKYVFFL